MRFWKMRKISRKQSWFCFSTCGFIFFFQKDWFFLLKFHFFKKKFLWGSFFLKFGLWGFEEWAFLDWSDEKWKWKRCVFWREIISRWLGQFLWIYQILLLCCKLGKLKIPQLCICNDHLLCFCNCWDCLLI